MHMLSFTGYIQYRRKTHEVHRLISCEVNAKPSTKNFIKCFEGIERPRTKEKKARINMFGRFKKQYISRLLTRF
ncbi:hypothetical protein Fmac_006181 [Flemingia macrophylla]|uniref:Ribosomal protein L33 n=1 Tax=Flemingia macrophylla TaxID=520843 RepID=A0ABD1NAE1_9FABA